MIKLIGKQIQNYLLPCILEIVARGIYYFHSAATREEAHDPVKYGYT